LSARSAVRLALLVFAAASAAFAFGSARFTWQNEGLRIDRPPRQGAAALVSSAALATAALSGRSRALSATGLAAAAVLAALGASRLAWRIDAVQDGLRERTIAGSTRIAWRDVERVEPREQAIRLRGRDGTQIVVSAGGFSPEDRTRLERTIARRVREAAR
jgi:hypothetical protein